MKRLLRYPWKIVRPFVIHGRPYYLALGLMGFTPFGNPGTGSWMSLLDLLVYVALFAVAATLTNDDLQAKRFVSWVEGQLTRIGQMRRGGGAARFLGQWMRRAWMAFCFGCLGLVLWQFYSKHGIVVTVASSIGVIVGSLVLMIAIVVASVWVVRRRHPSYDPTKHVLEDEEVFDNDPPMPG